MATRSKAGSRGQLPDSARAGARSKSGKFFRAGTPQANAINAARRSRGQRF